MDLRGFGKGIWRWVGAVLGAVLVLIGAYQAGNYKEHGVQVTAVITEVKTSSFEMDGSDKYRYTYYGRYTYNGKEYTDVKLDSERTFKATPSKSVGDTVAVKVSDEQPDKTMPTGVVWLSVGAVVIAVSVMQRLRSRKAKNNP